MGGTVVSDDVIEQPVMYGERIWLRPIEPRDALALSQSSEAPEDDQVTSLHIPVSETAFRNWIARNDDASLVWAICRTDQQDLIGTASIRNINLRFRTAETGMGLIYPEDRGIGLGREVKSLVLDFAFEVMGLHSLMCTIDARNTRSQRSVERSGYTRAGSYTADIALGLGRYADTLVYQILAAEWRTQR
jgi:RimJ/RimL family protein N-acetyltransferase